MKSKSWLIVNNPKVRRYFLILLAVLFTVTMFARDYFLILSEPLMAWTVDPAADCAVVLTGGAGRVKEGFALLARKQVKKLIVSGVHPDSDLREIMPHWNLMGDLSEKDVILEKRSSTTYGNAQQTLAIVETLQCRDLLLVTSQTHMRRSYQTFFGTFPEGFSIMKFTLKSSHSESQFTEVSTEVLKTWFYSLWAY